MNHLDCLTLLSLTAMNDLHVLTTAELRSLVKDELPLSREVRARKETMIAYIASHASPRLMGIVEAAAFAKGSNRKRQRLDGQDGRRVERRVEAEAERRPHPHNYLALPSDDERRECYSAFYASTGNEAVRSAVCAVCAREMNATDGGVERIRLDSVEHRSRLRPRDAHPAHDLYDGCLLEPTGVVEMAGGTLLDICRGCRQELRRNVPLPPKFSLANNLWIGRVPQVLAVLTVPEQMLVAQLFPRVYVFKLFPKTPGFRPPTESLQRSMRGTVSTYELDTQGIANMADGDLLPRPVSVLASVISVTFVGVGSLPKRWLRSTFRVRRDIVRCALRQLQQEHRHYRHITVSQERLAALPEDDVPEELLSVVRQCTDAGASIQEGAGYAARYEDEDDEGYTGVPESVDAEGTGEVDDEVIDVSGGGAFCFHVDVMQDLKVN